MENDDDDDLSLSVLFVIFVYKSVKFLLQEKST